MEHANEKHKLVRCRRLGEKEEEKKRPDTIWYAPFLARSGLVREVEGMEDEYICPDRTVEERSKRKRLFSEIKQ